MPNPPNLPNTWITSLGVVNARGQALTTQLLNSACPDIGQGQGGGGGGGLGGHSKAPQAVVNTAPGLRGEDRDHAITKHWRIQPASRYWPLQWYELAIFLSAAVILADVCLWRIRRS